MPGRKRGQNEGSIYRMKDGRWRGAISLGYRDGKRLRKVLTGKTRREVAERLNRALQDHALGLPLKPERQTVRQYLYQWLNDCVKPRTRYSTHSSYARLVERHIVPAIGRNPLNKLGPQHVQRFLNERLEAGLAPRTVQYLRAILRSALADALKFGLVPRNVAALVAPPRQSRPKVRPLMPEQARRFLDAVKGHRLEALYMVALAIGLRIGEALGLHWSDVDLDAGRLTVRVAIQRIEGKLPFVEPKSDRGCRTIRLPGVAVSALREHRMRQERERLLAGSRWQETDLVFTTTIGTPMDASNITKHFKKTLRLLGLPDQRLHDLRHACASFLLAQGVNPRTVMEILGHSQVSLTLGTYSHLLPSVMQDAATKIDDLLRPVATRVATRQRSAAIN